LRLNLPLAAIDANSSAIKKAKSGFILEAISIPRDFTPAHNLLFSNQTGGQRRPDTSVEIKP